MKTIYRPAFLILSFILVFVGTVGAQKQYKAPYLVAAHSNSGAIKFRGKLIAINDTALVILDKKNKVQYAPISKIDFIRVDKNRSDIGFGIITAAAVAGNIALALSYDDALTSIAIGAGGTVVIVAVMSVVHGIVHPPILKLKTKDLQFTAEALTQKLTPYVAQEVTAL